LDVNFYDQLSINKEPYDLQREALLASGAQSMDAAREADSRGVAATAGRIQMAQNEKQGEIRADMGNEMATLEKLSATEDSILAGEKVKIDKEEVIGQQMAAANREDISNAQLNNAMTGVTSMATQLASMPALYKKISASKLYEDIMGQANTQGLAPQDLRNELQGLAFGNNANLSGVDEMKDLEFKDFMSSLNPSQLKNISSYMKMRQSNIPLKSDY
jgi:DNA-binding transcriptional regulator YdaS (Cro superfamily)